MSDDTAKPQLLTRVPRREALKGLGALAVTGTAFAAVGCSTETMMGEADDAASTGVSGTATPSSSSTTTGSIAGSSSAKPVGSTSATTKPAMTASTASTPATASAGGSSAASASGSATAGAAATSTGGSPAVGGTSPGAAAAGSTAGGSGGAGAMTPAMGAVDISSLACIMTPAQEEGPFFIEEKLNRSDLLMGESDEAIINGVPFALTIGVYKVNGMMCEPMPGLQVDIWHANANGIYSDISPGFVQSTDTKGKQYLRGFQVTGDSGVVQFSTIYPGWYPSRTIHIHFKIRMPMGNNSAYDFTSQMYFDENVTKDILTMGPYAKTPGTRMIFNDDDHIFNGTSMNGQKPANGKPPGNDTMVTLAKAGSGYTGTLKIGLKI